MFHLKELIIKNVCIFSIIIADNQQFNFLQFNNKLINNETVIEFTDAKMNSHSISDIGFLFIKVIFLIV
jgi:hypothetical protein